MNKFFKKIDGYKTLSGLIISGIGFAMFFNPVTAPFAKETLITGITTTVGGLAHKAVKHKQNQKEKTDGS